MGGSAPAPSIPGIKADRQLKITLATEVAHLLGRESTSFPGAQPVSFAARHLLELQKQDYYVCEKSDGIRCLMYLTNEGPREVTYLIDRKNDYYHVEGLHFPLPGDDEILYHMQTLVDGELVNDTQPNGTIQLKFLVFDCMILDGKRLIDRPLDKRLGYFLNQVFKPYQSLYKKYPEEIQWLPFIVESKKMEFSYGIEMMFREVLPNLPHGNDGLIFTCKNTPYKPGTDPHIIKWKTETENSIDFMMTLLFPMLEPDSEDERDGITDPYLDYAAMPTFNLSVWASDGYQHYGTMFATEKEWEDLKALQEPLDDRIVECYLDAQNRWRYIRFRDDKKDANYIDTVTSVIESIQDAISERDLIANAKKIRDEWKKRQAAEEAASRMDMVARKSVSATSATSMNGQAQGHGLGQNGTTVAKRKLDSGEYHSGSESNKRRHTPQPGP
ncbi:Dcp1p-Dcp2p decapping enzyme complex alpha subunit [Ptychographa xylographoides]|nr:Dcp1p-Dcp2p decapping enzyme complex alpha subunit [Ptychographa xylographoides]